MSARRRGAARPFASLVAAGLAAAACGSEGSDVGPRLDRLPDATLVAFVLDDQNRGVAGARVQVGAHSGVTSRNGRTDLFANLGGPWLVTVAGDAASAAAGDRLGALAFTATLSSNQVPYAVHLPDMAPSAGLVLAAGTQGAPAILDDAATSGARLEVPAGTSVGVPQGANVTVRTGLLQEQHLPGELPAQSSGALLVGRGVFVDPPDVTFAPAVDLVVTDDLAMPIGGTATLLFLDPATGTWTSPPSALVSVAAGLLRATGGVARGGLYAFAVNVPATANVRGRVRDTAGNPLGGAFVTADQWRGTTFGDGTFVSGPLAATNGSGGARPARLELQADGRRLPAVATAAAPLVAGTTADAGDLTLDSEFAGNVRVQAIKRSRAEPLRRFALSSLDGAMTGVTFTDGNGQGAIEDVPSRWFGFTEGHVRDSMQAWILTGIPYLEDDRRWLDLNVFHSERYWLAGSRNTRCAVLDTIGGGPIRRAAVVQGNAANQGFAGHTTEGGVVFVGRGFAGRATASVRTERSGFAIVHALTFDDPDCESLDFPLQRVNRTPLGAFDRFGLVTGTVTGASALAEQRLRVTRRLELQEWLDDVVGEEPLQTSLPIEVDPATTHGPFTAGVAAPAGHLAVVEGTTSPAGFALTSLGLALDVVPTPGAVIARDLPLAHPATTVFQAPQALANLDPAIATSALRFDLAIEQPSGRIVDVVRGVGPNVAAAGSDAMFTLPALGNELTGHHWLAALSGTVPAGAFTIGQRSFLRLGPAGAVLAVPLQAVPDVTEPAPGATVAATGFFVRFSVPPGTLFTSIELRSETATERLLWQATVPPIHAEFDFWQLPVVDAATPLVAGRTYQLTVRSHRATVGLHSTGSPPYRDRLTAFHSVGGVERGDDAVSWRTLTVTAN